MSVNHVLYMKWYLPLHYYSCAAEPETSSLLQEVTNMFL